MIKLLSKNIIIYGGANALKSLVPLLMLPILTKYLSISDFGILSLVETTILFVAPFVLLNINGAINVEYFKVEHKILKEYITNALAISFISFLIIFFFFFLFKDYISSLLHIDSGLTVIIVVFSLFRVLSSVLLGLYQSKQESIKFFIFTIAQTFIDFVLSYIFVVLFNLGYIGRLTGTYATFFIFSVIAFYLLYKMDYLSRITFKYSKDILSFGIPLIPHAISGTIMAMSDRYFISYFIGNEQVGLYAIAYQMSALMLLIGVSINQAWSPMMFKLLTDKNFKQIYDYIFYLFILFILIGVGIFFLRDILFYIFVDKKFFVAKEYFSYLLIGFIFQSLYLLVTNLLFFEKKTKILAVITMIGATFNIFLNYFLIQEYDAIGVAYATAITWGVFFVLVASIDIKVLRRRS